MDEPGPADVTLLGCMHGWTSLQGGLSIVVAGSLAASAGCTTDDAPSDGTETGTSTGDSGPGVVTSADGSDSSSAAGGSTSGLDSTGGDDDGTTGSTGGSDDSGDSDGSSEGTTGFTLGECTDPAKANYPGTQGALDVLFVVDNSASMGAAQARLAAAMDSFVARLDNEGQDYRIAVTTTDVGNPWCSGTTPEAGRFVASSCRSRIDEFEALGDDVSDIACSDICPYQTITLSPTTTAVDPTPTARPWIERIAGETNLPGGVTPAEALRCFLPQGVSGCGFEQPLEAMYRAVLRAELDNGDEYGFFRDGSERLIVLVTDENDCSFSLNGGETIFLPEGDRTFWSDPEALSPTSAVCWNAGVTCTGQSPYDECFAENKDATGAAPVAGEDAVLRPLSRILEELDGLDGPGATSLSIAVIGGVAEDYPLAGEIIYADDPDPDAQNSFGIGPGCVAAGFGQVAARPPVRMKEIAEAYEAGDARNLYSICSPQLCDELELVIDDVLAE